MTVQRNISVDQEAWERLKQEAGKRKENVRALAGEIIADSLKPAKGSGPKAIILAAGMSGRMMQLTKDMPKCMLEIGGKSILQRQVETLGKAGVSNVVVVRGYKRDKISLPGVKYVYNANYRRNNILESLMAAKAEMTGQFIAAYADILYGRQVVEALKQSKGDICIVVDSDWKKAYDGRYQHPVEEAEKVVIKKGRVAKIAKVIPGVEADGEFIGLVKFSEKGAKALKQNYERLKREHVAKPFHAAASLEKAYMTDMLQELVDKGHKVTPVTIKGGWIELDTEEDFQKAKKLFRKSSGKVRL